MGLVVKETPQKEEVAMLEQNPSKYWVGWEYIALTKEDALIAIEKEAQRYPGKRVYLLAAIGSCVAASSGEVEWERL